MTDYGKGGVLGTAIALPATSAAGLFFLNSTHTWIIAGFIGLSFMSSAILAAYLIRYFANK